MTSIPQTTGSGQETIETLSISNFSALILYEAACHQYALASLSPAEKEQLWNITEVLHPYTGRMGYLHPRRRIGRDDLVVLARVAEFYRVTAQQVGEREQYLLLAMEEAASVYGAANREELLDRASRAVMGSGCIPWSLGGLAVVCLAAVALHHLLPLIGR